MPVLDHYPWAVLLHLLGALGLYVALAMEWLAAHPSRPVLRRLGDPQSPGSPATLSAARRIGAVSMALLVVPGLLMAVTRWTFLAWPAAGLIGMAMLAAVGLLLRRRPTWQVQSVQIRLAIALGVVVVMVFKPELGSSLTILAAAMALGIGSALIVGGGPRSAGSKLSSGDVVPRHELEHAPDFPSAVVADPHKELYVEFGVEASPRALLDPRVWVPILVGVARSALRILQHKGPPPKLIPTSGRLGLPADFLIASDGRLVAVKYGAHAYDQWSVDELVALAQRATGALHVDAAPHQVRSAT